MTKEEVALKEKINAWRDAAPEEKEKRRQEAKKALDAFWMTPEQQDADAKAQAEMEAQREAKKVTQEEKCYQEAKAAAERARVAAKAAAYFDKKKVTCWTGIAEQAAKAAENNAVRIKDARWYESEKLAKRARYWAAAAEAAEEEAADWLDHWIGDLANAIATTREAWKKARGDEKEKWRLDLEKYERRYNELIEQREEAKKRSTMLRR